MLDVAAGATSLCAMQHYSAHCCFKCPCLCPVATSANKSVLSSVQPADLYRLAKLLQPYCCSAGLHAGGHDTLMAEVMTSTGRTPDLSTWHIEQQSSVVI